MSETQRLLDDLSKPFPSEAIKTRSGGGNTRLSYVEAHTVIRRLNAATGGRWDFQVLNEMREGDLLKATCRLTIPDLGSREHVGVQKVSERGGEDLHKGAISDALKKCATLFGVGLELYGEDYEGADDPLAPVLDHLADLDSRHDPYANIKQYATERWGEWSPAQQKRVTAAMQAIKARREDAGIKA